jgi:hypothetical protein
VLDIFKLGSHKLFAWCWLWTLIFLISASWVLGLQAWSAWLPCYSCNYFFCYACLVYGLCLPFYFHDCVEKKTQTQTQFLLLYNTDHFWHLICGSFSPHTNKQASNSAITTMSSNTVPPWPYLPGASIRFHKLRAQSPRLTPLSNSIQMSVTNPRLFTLWCVWLCIGLPTILFWFSMNVTDKENSRKHV